MTSTDKFEESEAQGATGQFETAQELEFSRFRIRDGERLLDAEILLRLTEEDTLEVILESSGSAKRNGVSVYRNPEYKLGLETLLRRVTAVAFSLDDCLVDSKQVHKLGLSAEERRVQPHAPFSFPLTLVPTIDFSALRLALTGPQTSIGSHAKKGGNATKRIVMRFTLRDPGTSLSDVLTALEAETVDAEKKRRRDIAFGVTAADIEASMNEWRLLGAEAFHKKYETHPAERFIIAEPDGTEFDAKAILMGARFHAGLDGKNDEFRGERETVAMPLVHLGFLVEDLRERIPGELTSDSQTLSEDQAKIIQQAQRFAGATDSKAETKIRREQGLLRRALGLGGGSHKCSICGRTYPDQLLVAAHIKKRSECNESERVDIPAIAFVACALGCDALFEHGYVIVDVDGVIVPGRIAKDLHLAELVGEIAGQPVGGVTEASMKYFAWHREFWIGSSL